jgi:transcriptional regulator with XRE-family HTH domain
MGQMVGLSLRTLRAERGLTQEQTVEILRQVGLNWTRANVASLESGRRQDLTVTELVLLSTAFDVPPGRWLEANGAVYMVGLGTASALNVGLASLLAGQKPSEPIQVQLSFEPEPIFLEAELHAAERLGVEPAKLRRTTERLWKRRLVEEREKRLGSDRIVGSNIPPAKRGHVTRVLLRELQIAMNEEDFAGAG